MNNKNNELKPTPKFFSETDHVAPRTKLEEKLCNIFQEILGIKKVGINDDFFCIGEGLTTLNQFTAACQRELDIHIPCDLLLKTKTIARLSPCILKLKKVIAPCAEVAKYPLSFSQEQLLFIENFEQGTHAYHMPYLVKLSDNVNLIALEAAFNVVINRHPVLKSIYRTDEKNNSYQHALTSDVAMDMHVLDEKSELLPKVKKEISRPFDLTHEPSIRLHCYETPSHRYLLLLFHHIAFDVWSNQIFRKEVSQAYQALCQGAPHALPDLDISYVDYTIWQRRYLQGNVLTNLQTFWQQQLLGVEQFRLPTDYPRPKKSNHQGRSIDFQLDPCLSEQLRALAKAKETTMYTVLLSSFYITLSAISGQNDIVLGTPAANRDHKQTQSLIGFFVNTLVLRSNVQSGTTINAFIKQVHHIVRQAKAHQALPFAQLLDLLSVERDPSRHPIFQVMLSLKSFNDSTMKNISLPFETIYSEYSTNFYTPAQFDLTLFLDSRQATITGNFVYAVSLFDEETIKRISGLYQRVLKAVVANQQQCIGDIALLNESDSHTLLHTWNNTDAPYPEDKTLQQLFEAQVAKTPDNIALVFEEEQLTYKQLNERANQLAYAIRAHYQGGESQGIKPDTLIALYLDRSLEMVISILGVLKAGGAYVPISPDYPSTRTQYILNDTKTSLILTQQHYMKQLNNCITELEIKPTLLVTDDLSEDLKTVNLAPISTAKDLAYVIYTSGTTGQPKGVLQLHTNVLRLFASSDEHFDFNSNDTWVLFHDYTFDFSVWELWGSLLYGGRIIIPAKNVTRDIHKFVQLCINEKVSILNQTPAAFYLFIDTSLRADFEFSYLRYVIFGGDKLSLSRLKPWWDIYAENSPRLINMYGITETTVHVTYKSLSPKSTLKGSIIGKPLKDVQTLVLNERRRLVPIGAPGELYIGGAGLARGYLNQAELTSVRFINNPFATNNDKAKGYTRLYKTG
ncbi:MAG: amino acid adenylation domain-containing protein, partial [Psychromonas sp.]|nr:amino acid adenylation domain-containing protein [Psychromonas sp.]